MQCPELHQLLRCFYPLCRYTYLKVLSQRPDRTDDRQSLATMSYPADEGAVDLQRIDRETVQIAQGGIARPEIIDVQPHMPGFQS